jgi:hypothetical protein
MGQGAFTAILHAKHNRKISSAVWIWIEATKTEFTIEVFDGYTGMTGPVIAVGGVIEVPKRIS